MKTRSSILIVMFEALILTTFLTERTFGQGYYETFGEEGGGSFINEFMFTPQQNITFSDPTFAITDFIDLTQPPNNATVILFLCYDITYYEPGFPIHEPDSGYFEPEATATINENTGPDYTFNLTASLQANTPYWLGIYMGGPDGRNLIAADWNAIQAIQSGVPSPADVVINGYEYGPGGDGTYIPINVPEPSTITLSALSFLCAGVYARRFRGEI
jgi:hypothetical protein